MSRLAWGVLIGGTFVSAVLLGFGLTLIWSARRERRAAQKRVGPGLSIAEAGIERQTRRLAAELDDPAKVDAWLEGGPR